MTNTYTLPRPTLLEIRDALNKIPEETLKVSSITVDLGISDVPSGEFAILFLDVENGAKHVENLAMDDLNVLYRFTKKLQMDLEFVEENKDDEFPEQEPDW